MDRLQSSPNWIGRSVRDKPLGNYQLAAKAHTLGGQYPFERTAIGCFSPSAISCLYLGVGCHSIFRAHTGLNRVEVHPRNGSEMSPSRAYSGVNG
jgi:hypothetical protein